MSFSRSAVVFLVPDPAAARDFFVDHLGCRVQVDLGWYVDLGHPDHPALTVDFVAEGHPSMPPGLGAAAGSVLALVVDDAQAEERRLLAAGVELLAGCRDEPWGQRHFFARTPGPVLEVVQQIDPDPAWLSANGL
ncbi:hypothetical protein BJP25_26360 [Actinokineospora bangkokensis]|uniref:VOC domain-containing protein n=2 Tax=Actinokineospora bangkokensis TaxID=1193682 RepID=A0A1Q9LHI0_9PSEU|nr:hypothetical protein BJP25_26360 [Actinokineospora bangkokensis]